MLLNLAFPEGFSIDTKVKHHMPCKWVGTYRTIPIHVPKYLEVGHCWHTQPSGKHWYLSMYILYVQVTRQLVRDQANLLNWS